MFNEAVTEVWAVLMRHQWVDLRLRVVWVRLVGQNTLSLT